MGTRVASPGTLAQVAEQAIAQPPVPGMVVGVWQDGEQEAYGFGTANVMTGAPVTAGTVFRVASITKLFTATLAMRLVEEGILQLDTPISVYMPDLRLADRRAQSRITLRHLLSHQSGLAPAYHEDLGLGDDALARAIVRLHAAGQLTRPGTVWSYSNAGYHLTGRLIAQVLDTPFEEAMRSMMLRPLGLEHTYLGSDEVPADSLATGHNPPVGRGGTATLASQEHERYRNPSSGILSTAGDLLQFAAMHLRAGTASNGTRVLRPETVRAMQRRQVRAGTGAEHYGLGWALKTVAGERVVWHGGNANGFITQMTLVPQRRFALVILTNSAQGGTAIERIEPWLLSEHCGLRPSPQWDRLRLAVRWRLWRLRLIAGVIAWRLHLPLVG